MLLGDDVTRFRLKGRMKFSTPCAVRENLAPCSASLNGCDIFPGRIVPFTPTVMRRDEDPNSDSTRRLKHFDHIRDALHSLGSFFGEFPKLAALGDEVVIRIDDEKRGDGG